MSQTRLTEYKKSLVMVKQDMNLGHLGNSSTYDIAKMQLDVAQAEFNRASAQLALLKSSKDRSDRINDSEKNSIASRIGYMERRKERLKITSPVGGRVSKIMVGRRSCIELGAVMCVIE